MILKWQTLQSKSVTGERHLASDHILRAYQEEDAVRGKHNYLDEAKELHHQYVTLYKKWVVLQTIPIARVH